MNIPEVPVVRVFFLIIIGISMPVYAAPPDGRLDCAVGWFDASVETALSIEPIEVLDIQLNTRGGDGNAISCSVQVLDGLYVYGELGRADAQLDVALTFDNETAVGTFGLEAKFQRLGLGYAHPIGDQLSLFGQIGYLNSVYDFEPIFVILDSGGAQFGPADLENESEGVDLELGLSWMPSDRLELSGFARFAGNNSLSFDGDGGLAFVRDNKNDFRIGTRARFQLTGPAFFAADAEFGDMDTLFLGLGLRF